MRFELAYCDYDWWAIKDNNENGVEISGQEVVDIMNELENEIKELKKKKGVGII